MIEGDFKETVIEHLNGDEHFTITTNERRYKTMIEKIKGCEGVEIRAVSEDGCIVAHVPKSFVKIRKPKRVSEEQKQRLANLRRGKEEDEDDDEV